MNMKQIYTILFLFVFVGAWGQAGRLHRLSEDPAAQKKTLNYSVVGDTVINATTENRNYNIDLQYQKTISDRFSTYTIYSVRNINSDYNGPAFDVVNDQGTEATIYYVNGIYDTTSVMALAVSSTEDVYVKRWYDSGGSGVDIKQSVTTAMPRLVIDSVLQKANGALSVYFDGGDMLYPENPQTQYGTDTLSVMFVFRRNGSFDVPFSFSTLSSTGGSGMRYESTVLQLGGDNGFSGASSSFQSSLDSIPEDELVDLHFTINADTAALYIKNSYITPTLLNKGDWNGFSFAFGGRLTSGFTVENPSFNGFMSEFLLFKNNLINSRNDLHYDVNGFYNIDDENKNAIINKGYNITLPSLDTISIGTQVVINTTNNARQGYVISIDSIYSKGALLPFITTRGNNSYTFQAVKDSRDRLSWQLIGSTDISYTNADTIGVVNLFRLDYLPSKRYEVGKIVKLSNGAEYEIVQALIPGTTVDGIGQIQLANNNYARIRGEDGAIKYSWFEKATTNPDSNHLIGQAALNYALFAPGINEVLFDYDTATFKDEMFIPPHITARGLSKTGADFDDNIKQYTYADFQGDTTKWVFRTLQTGEYYVFGAGAKDFYIEAVSEGGGGVFCDSGWGNHFENITIEGTSNKYFHDGFAVSNSLHVRGENIYVLDCIRDFSGNVPASNSGSIGGGSNVRMYSCGAQGGDYGLYNFPRSSFFEINMEAQDSTSIYSDAGSNITIYKIEGERNIKLFDLPKGDLRIFGGKYTSLGGVSTTLGTVDTGSVHIMDIERLGLSPNSGITTANTSSFVLENNAMNINSLSEPGLIFYDMGVVTLKNNYANDVIESGREKPLSIENRNELVDSYIKRGSLLDTDLSGTSRLSITATKDTLNMVPHSAFYNELSDWEGVNVSGVIIAGDTVITNHLGDTTTAIYVTYSSDIGGSVSYIDYIDLNGSIYEGENYNVSFYAFRKGSGSASLLLTLRDDRELKFPPIISSEPHRYSLHKTAESTQDDMYWRMSNGATAGDTIFIYGVQVSKGIWERDYQKTPTIESDNPYISVPNGSLEVRGNTTITGTLTAEKYHTFQPVQYNALDTITVDTLNTAFAIPPDLDGLDVTNATYTTNANVSANTTVRLLYYDVSADTYTAFGSGTITSSTNQIQVTGLTQTVTSGDWIYAEVTASGGEANGLSVNLRFQ